MKSDFWLKNIPILRQLFPLKRGYNISYVPSISSSRKQELLDNNLGHPGIQRCHTRDGSSPRMRRIVKQTSPPSSAGAFISRFINNLSRGRSETLLPATLSGFCIALCSSHLASRAPTLPLIDISVIYGTRLPWPSSNWRWACDSSPPQAAGREAGGSGLI